MRAGCPVEKLEGGGLAWHVDPLEAWLKETKRLPKILADLEAGAGRKKPGPKPGTKAAPPAPKAALAPNPHAPARPREGKIAPPQSQMAGLTAARRRKAEAEARKLELIAEQLAGDLIPRKEAEALMVRIGERLNSLAMAVPGRLSGRLARMNDTSQVHLALEEAMRELLSEVSDEFGRAASE